jgi:HSP20 family protein
MLLEKWTPFRELDLIPDRRMRRFFEDLGFAPVLTPAADIYETEGEVVVELEVPGFDEKELAIEIVDHTLSITGERKTETEKKEKALQLHERLETTFARRFVLPVDLDSEHVSAQYDKGVLAIHVPKMEQNLPQKIAIKKV